MKIYHYTKIETFGLILKNKTIRFNRLDQVDDPDEYIHGSGPYDTKLGPYTFVSCWTKQKEEIPDLWEKYTENKGVRIGLPEELFETYQFGNGFKSFFKNPMNLGLDYLITPFINPAKLYDIVYLDEQEEKVKELLIPVGEAGALIETERVGLYKKLKWREQEESRFKINVTPFDTTQLKPDFGGLTDAVVETLSLIEKKKIEETNALEVFIDKVMNKGVVSNFLCDMADLIGPSIAKEYKLKETFIDMPLKKGVFDGIEVIMGPQTSDEDKKRVEEMLKDYANYHLYDSTLKR